MAVFNPNGTSLWVYLRYHQGRRPVQNGRDEKTIRKHVNKIFADGNKLIDDHTLVALTIMIAESKPDEKEMMISVIMNCICG